MKKESERLQKVIAQSGITSRRKAEQLILEGKVSVNHQTITELGTKVSFQDEVEVEGVPIEKEKHVYYLFYKPREVITSVKDDKGRKTVVDYFEEVPERIYPVGRLDYDSSGILILTNDGNFANILMHPKYEVSKVYVAKVKGIPSQDQLRGLKKGIKSEDDILKLTSYKVLSTDRKRNTAIIEIVLQEGKNRHIRRMMEVLGYPVAKLKREKYGTLDLKGLQSGKYRKLTAQEVVQLKNLINNNVIK